MFDISNTIRLNGGKTEIIADDITLQIPHLQAQSVNTVHFRAPVDNMLKRLVEKGLAKFRKRWYCSWHCVYKNIVCLRMR